jgi:hypothetical protein
MLGAVMEPKFEWDQDKDLANATKHGGSMKKPIRYEDFPMKVGPIVADFLPSPKDLVRREVNVRVTLNLSNASLHYFRELGKKNKMPYQKLIRRLLDEYVRKAA